VAEQMQNRTILLSKKQDRSNSVRKKVKVNLSQGKVKERSKKGQRKGQETTEKDKTN
jgi:hypothetical protein